MVHRLVLNLLVVRILIGQIRRIEVVLIQADLVVRHSIVTALLLVSIGLHLHRFVASSVVTLLRLIFCNVRIRRLLLDASGWVSVGVAFEVLLGFTLIIAS